ncbi:hypothetical protein DFH09DRAFT_1124111 [Mycena vulgaris]|nr:hypothetical protein DFH09DRAFT_1124111 [Mycena vulgaris]
MSPNRSRGPSREMSTARPCLPKLAFASDPYFRSRACARARGCGLAMRGAPPRRAPVVLASDGRTWGDTSSISISISPVLLILDACALRDDEYGACGAVPPLGVGPSSLVPDLRCPAVWYCGTVVPIPPLLPPPCPPLPILTIDTRRARAASVYVRTVDRALLPIAWVHGGVDRMWRAVRADRTLLQLGMTLAKRVVVAGGPAPGDEAARARYLAWAWSGTGCEGPWIDWHIGAGVVLSCGV